jgi:hypothetical protein
VSWQNSQSTCTNGVTGIAYDFELVSREVWNSAIILQILGIAISDDTDDLILDAAGEIFDGAMDECCALAVSSVRLYDHWHRWTRGYL